MCNSIILKAKKKYKDKVQTKEEFWAQIMGMAALLDELKWVIAGLGKENFPTGPRF